MTSPITISSTGSMTATKRPSRVSISSSKKSATLVSISRSAPVASPTSTIRMTTDGNIPRAARAAASASPSRTRWPAAARWSA